MMSPLASTKVFGTMVATVVSTAVPKERIADAPSLTLAESSGVAQLKLVVVAIYTSLKFS
jgi:hypothetical protein